MQDIPTWIMIASGAIAISSALIGLTVYLTKLKLQGSRQLRTLQSELDEKRSTTSALEASVWGLTKSLDLLRKGKEASLNLLNEMDELLKEARDITGAMADSILIRNPYSDEELVFLTIHGEAANKIRKMRIPIKGSIAGTVYRSGRLSFYPAKHDSEVQHYDSTDKKSGFRSDYILSAPLKVGEKTIGVLQLLNKRQRTPFNDEDYSRIEHLCHNMATRAQALITDPDSLKLLGVVEKPDDTTATILFADITHFSTLFENLKSSLVTDFVNEYFDRLCSIALRNGGTIDKLLGDGFMVRYNVPRPLSNYASAAVRSSLSMQMEFKTLQEEWLRLGQPVQELGHRIGISTGPVMGGMMGHPQYLSYTVIGPAVNKATHLCEISRECDSGILACKDTFALVQHELRDFAIFIESKIARESVVYEVRSVT